MLPRLSVATALLVFGLGCRSSTSREPNDDTAAAPSAEALPSVPNGQPSNSALLNLHEEVVRVPLDEAHPAMTLEATLFRPSGAGPFPLIVMSHGAIGKRNPAPRWRPVEQARWFVSRGFVVLVPMRRGNAQSDGDWVEGIGSCEHADFTRPNRESASDIRAAVAFASRRPYVDGQRVVLLGWSAGGFASLALASASPPGILGVINFAGGRGAQSNNEGQTRHDCSPDALVSTAGSMGSTTHVPTLWLYAQNDHFFPPPLARRMYDAFHAGSPGATFVPLPAFGEEGHSIAGRPQAIPLWSGHVEHFLAQLGLQPHG